MNWEFTCQGPRLGRTCAGVLLATALALTGCGGGGGASTQPVQPTQPTQPAIPNHAEASLALTDANTPYLLAQAQAVQMSLHRWVTVFIDETGELSPAQPTRGYPCAAGSFSATYKDLDGNGRESAGDQIQTTATGCSSITPLGDGGTLLTVLAVDGTDITDARVAVDGVRDDSTLYELYGQRMSGTFRFLQVADNAIHVQSEGDVQLTLNGGRVLKLRNLALTYTVDVNGKITGTHITGVLQSGQFDLLVDNGAYAGALVQVDTLGYLMQGGQNQWPTPGQLQISGRNATRARLTGSFLNGVGAQFETLVDTAGTGQFRQLSVLGLQQFYAPMQP
jgi:hypothetical protein